MEQYRTFPLNTQKLINAEKILLTSSTEESINQYIHLLLLSSFKEKRFDAQFGSAIWDKEFDLVTDISWRDAITDSIERSIKKYETRLITESVVVKLNIHETDLRVSKENIGNKNSQTLGSTLVRRRLSISIEGRMVETNERYLFNEVLYIAPMSISLIA